jgi:serine/threonine protein kinase
MDTSLYTERFHPMRLHRSLDSKRYVYPTYTRTQRRPRYYIIDFGIARRYRENDMPPMERTGYFGSDMTVPEFKTPNEPHNPFPIDIYCLGNVIHNDILQVCEISGYCVTHTFTHNFRLGRSPQTGFWMDFTDRSGYDPP